MWDLEKTDSQNLEVQETKNIVRHPEGVQVQRCNKNKMLHS